MYVITGKEDKGVLISSSLESAIDQNSRYRKIIVVSDK